MDMTSAGLPGWVPDTVQTYLAHVVHGRSIRSLARGTGCHASTILRQVRRCEMRRDDPLVDHALLRLGRAGGGATAPDHVEGHRSMTSLNLEKSAPETDRLELEARRILRRLSEQGACLAVASGMETAVVVREDPNGQTIRTGTVDKEIAEAMALRDWIASSGNGRVLRYRVTSAGRAALRELIATDEREPEIHSESGGEHHARYGMAETPILMLARRRDRDGTPFLSTELVRAGERLREDYEIAAMDGVPEGGWESFLGRPPEGDTTARGPEGARARLLSALAELGPGLGDVTFRVCCQLEGLESVEKRMGWAARSGKIVLRIALQRLARYCEERDGPGGGMIG